MWIGLKREEFWTSSIWVHPRYWVIPTEIFVVDDDPIFSPNAINAYNEETTLLLCADESPQNFAETLVTSILNSLRVYIRSVHIRYEDDSTNNGIPVAVGLCMHSLSVENTNRYLVVNAPMFWNLFIFCDPAMHRHFGENTKSLSKSSLHQNCSLSCPKIHHQSKVEGQKNSLYVHTYIPTYLLTFFCRFFLANGSRSRTVQK